MAAPPAVPAADPAPVIQELSQSSPGDGRMTFTQAGDLATMRRMLEISQGCFSLTFAVCNDRALRNDLIGRLCESFPGLLPVEVPPGKELADKDQTVHAFVRDKLAKASVSVQGILVLDLESSIPFAAATYPTLRALNSSRELWERVACPVVFWLPDYAAVLLARHAPDFWRYRSHLFEFVPDRPAQAESLTQRAQTAAERSIDPEHHAIAALFDDLGALLQQINGLAGAEPLMRQTLAIAERTFGPDHPKVAIHLNNLAQLLQDTNRPAEAEPLLWQAQAAPAGQKFGRDDLRVVLCIYTLVVCLRETNQLAEAESLMWRVHIVDEQRFGAHSRNVTALDNLAALLQDPNRRADAERLIRRALALAEQNFGPDHPNVGILLNKLAQMMKDKGRPAAAEPLMRRALAINERNVEPEHPGPDSTSPA